MSDSASPHNIVMGLVRVISGDLPRLRAEAYLDPQIRIHMDSSNHRGITTWYKWIYLIRNCGRISNLRMTVHEAWSDPQNPGLVHVSMRWSGLDRSTGTSKTAPDIYYLRYLVRNSRIVEIWTHKINYVFIFGSWIRYSICYRLFLGWAILVLARQALRGNDFRSDSDRGLAVVNR